MKITKKEAFKLATLLRQELNQDVAIMSQFPGDQTPKCLLTAARKSARWRQLAKFSSRAPNRRKRRAA